MAEFSVLLARLSGKNSIAVRIIIVLLCLLSVFVILKSGFNANLLSLIPADAARTRLYLDLIKDFGLLDETYIVLDGNIMQNLPKVENFTGDLRRSPLVRDARYRLDPSVKKYFSDLLRKNVFLFMDNIQLSNALKSLSPVNITKRLRKIKDRLLLPAGGAAIVDPLGFSESMLAHMPSPDMPFDISSGLYLSDKGRRLFIVVKPDGEARDIDYDRKLLDMINASFMKNFKNAPSIKMQITGSHAITYYEQEIMKSDILRNIVTAFIGVFLIFVFFLRSLRGMLYAFIPVAASIVLTTGSSACIFGSMSEVSGAFGAMIVGLGVDLAIVLYIRYLYSKDIERSVSETSGAIWTGVLTTAATFYPMLLSDFGGIRQLGFLTGTGIIICALLIFSLSVSFMKGVTFRTTRNTLFEMLPLYAIRYKKQFLAAAVILSLISLYGVRDLGFSADLRGFGARHNKARELFQSLDIRRGGSFISGIVPDMEDVIKDSNHIVHKLEEKGIYNTVSIASFIPDAAQQLRNIRRIRSVNVRRLLKDFGTTAERLGFSDDHIHIMEKNIEKYFSVDRPVSLEDFQGTGMGNFLQRFFRKVNGGYRFVVMVNDKKDVRDIVPGYDVTGPKLVRDELSGMLRDNAGIITLVGMILVNIILFASFRNVKYVLYAQIPVMVAILVTGAIMNLLGIKIHIMNALVAVMLFGIGTDYSIHLIHHILRDSDINAIIRGTGRAVSIAAFTTIAGFGSIYFSSYRGLSEMGLAVTIGCILTLIFSLVLIPVFMNRQLTGGRE
ncbi:MMPL family protein [bacterium BMS3Abin07]|nr:MMPL family protein [bacterium BMS3Abin07]GBE32447.1 MMPL family protein [bacterium BMS3Bbin05]HDL20127.1 hypothetical protein [Nitrospirota bacterium]HDO23146.1 hypothetical protein [Nitrospirota bacterium]HDZ87763.1 hypothetical protein [Nitrospirota bacterium]